MILSCRQCNLQLTSDLYKAKVVWKRYFFSNVIINTSKIYNSQQHVKKGLFFESKPIPTFSYPYYVDEDTSINNICKAEPLQLIVGKDSIVDGLIPQFKEGYGCCDYSGGHHLSCHCGEHIANLHLDCYEDGTVRFLENKVDRLY